VFNFGEVQESEIKEVKMEKKCETCDGSGVVQDNQHVDPGSWKTCPDCKGVKMWSNKDGEIEIEGFTFFSEPEETRKGVKMNKLDMVLDHVINNQAKIIKSWLENTEMMGKIVAKLSDEELRHLEFQSSTEYQSRHDERVE
jgi:hypothetical protein